MGEDVTRSLNIRPYKGRQLGGSQRVYVYRNINERCWSIRAFDGPQRGKVVAHADSCALYDCTFHVNEAGRQRVLREGRKNVHAGIIGELAPDHDWIAPAHTILDKIIRYDPRLDDAFMTDDPRGVQQAVHYASHVHFGTDGVVRGGGVCDACWGGEDVWSTEPVEAFRE